MGNKNNAINYIEFPLVKNEETKQFYNQAFGWEFTQWGPKYLSFSGAGVDGGFNGEDDAGVTPPGVLVVLYANDLLKKCQEVENAGGKINKPIYGFPGGERFHFLDPNGNELAVWSE
ncbi:MAG: VOC family protein [Rhodospirillaceae bacterium]|nr:VOC family protein [Rhodospirillaceae bacterium]MBL6930387.1 VOC family protein [Rhodospirillales bacterium]MBL6941647.1 VOC family protein [Rhodospirillales bacterium]